MSERRGEEDEEALDRQILDILNAIDTDNSDVDDDDTGTDESTSDEEAEQIPLLNFSAPPVVAEEPMDTTGPSNEQPSTSRPTSSGSDVSNVPATSPGVPAAPTRQEEHPGREAQEGEVRVTVKSLDDREIIIVIGQNEPVQTLLDRARACLNIDTGSQRIIFSGRVIQGTTTIQEAGIQTGNTVHIVERSAASHNDRPNISAHFMGGPRIPAHEIPAILRRSAMQAAIDGEPNPNISMSRVRVPCQLNGVTVLHARFSEEIIEQKSLALSMRGLAGQRPQNLQHTNVFMQDPNYILWKIKVNEEPWLRPRQAIEQIVRQTLQELPFLAESTKANVHLKWDHHSSVLTIHFPEILPHIASPALERMDFLAFWTEHLQYFVDKLTENDGLVAAVKQVLEMTRQQRREVSLTRTGVAERLAVLDAIIRELEQKWAGLSHIKDYERARFRKNQHNEDYRRLKVEEISDSPRNPRYYMRHALDTELHDVIRHYRQQQRRFSELEELLDDLNQAGAIKFIRDSMHTTLDYRMRALSMFYHYMQRMRHQVAHMAHLVSEMDVPFLNPGCPQRLLPQYATHMIYVPAPYCGSLSFQMVTLPESGETSMIPTREVLPPPRVLSDVANRVNGDWPYLPYHPPSIYVDSVRSQRGQQVRVRAVIPGGAFPPGQALAQSGLLAGLPVPVPGTNGIVGIPVMAPAPAAIHQFHPPPPTFPIPTPQAGPDQHVITTTNPNDPFVGMSIADIVAAHQDHLENLLNQSMPPIERPGPRVTNVPNQRHRRVLSTTNGDTPSVPVETQPPPGEAARRYTTGRFNVHPDARGADTESLAPFPVQIEPSELQRIAKNIASRYREDALRRIAGMLAARFQDESWDTRLQNMPMCTMRECIAVALELLTASGNTVDESKNLMLALVRDEEVLVRAVTECVKSLFGRGEFPTHVARLILPRDQQAGARNDYESDHLDEGQSDELDGMIVRMPSDISQPQSGDLRAIRESRMRRRQMAESRNAAGPSTSVASTSSAPSLAGLSTSASSFGPEDTADIRNGRLPLGRRRVRETVHPTPARAESPSQISVTFTATNQPFMHGPFMPAQPGPSTVPLPQLPMPPTTWPNPMDMFPRPVVSPTPTTRGLLDFDISEASDQVEEQGHPGQNTPSSEPAGPSTSSTGALPRANSAPTTSNSSPTRQNLMQQILDDAARYTDYSLGLAGITEGAGMRVQAVAPAAVPGSVEPRRPHGAQEQAVRTVHRRTDPRPMVAIDPFMACTNRSCEINMMASLPTQESERLTHTSTRPDEDFMRHLQTLLPSIDRRPVLVDDQDSDYNYNLKKYANGELKFDDAAGFKKFIRTAIRSLMAHCIDSDTVHTMNMHPISGYPAACHVELNKLVRAHLSHRPPLTPAGEARVRQQRALDEIQRQQFEQVVLQQRQAERAVIFNNLAQATRALPPFANIAETERDALIAGRIANMLANIPEYMQNADNPRPPGVFGMLLELTYQRLEAHDYAQLARHSTAPNVITEYAGVIQRYIKLHYLRGRQGLTNTELYEIASQIANREEFFVQFLIRNPTFPTDFQFGQDPNDMLEVTWAMREVEIGFIKTVLTLATFHEHPRAIATFMMKIGNDYLYRNLVIFWRMAGRDMHGAHEMLKRVSTFFANIRFHQQSVTPAVYNAFADEWGIVLDRYFSGYSAFSEAEFVDFIVKSRAGSDWNEIDCYVPYPRSVTPSTEISDRISPAASADLSSVTSSRDLEASTSSLNTTVANNNSRKRNHTSGREHVPDTVDMVVAPLMTSLTTSEDVATNSDQPGTSGSQNNATD